MFFKKIEMHGFKSFAEPVTIEFNQGITGIVGPNGSGKSNISDAIRWVLGEQSPKMLRGGKMEEIIFNGTDSRKSRGMAEVTLVIDNSDDSLPIDYKEVAITRRMFRSGESEYHINGNQCRLRDIRELIMDTGIGVDGYSLIGQGKIDDIINNKTESRREIFEEAAGVVAYRVKKAEAEKKLESTNLNMERLQDIIGELEGRIDGLHEDSIKAKEYLGLRDRHKELEINIILKNIEGLELKNQYAEEDLRNINYSLDRLRSDKQELEVRISESNSRNETLEALSVDAREKLIKSIDNLNALVNRGELEREKLSAIEGNRQRLASEIDQLEEKKFREQTNAEGFADEKKKIDYEAEEENRKLHEKIEKFNELTGEMTALMEEADGYRNDIFEKSGEINSARAEINSLAHLQETLRKRQKELLFEKNTGEGINRETLDSLNLSKGEKAGIEESIEGKKARVEEMRSTLVNNQTRERSLAGEIEELRITLGRLRARKKTIEEMESNYEGYNNAVKHVMKSGLTGIHGVVAELIEVPKGYETAIETALGASLQNIVCDNDESAKRAIRSLKDNKAGRMTFLPLASIRTRGKRDESLRGRPGFIGFGPEIIHYDDKYNNVTEYLLGRVVVVDNMENAVRISRQGSSMRVVTLEGEIINAGGAITGGRYKNKTANILDRKTEIADLARQIAESRKKRESGEKKLKDLRDAIIRLTGEIEALEGEIRVDEHALILKDNEIQLSEKALNDIRNSAGRVEKELESISIEMDNSLRMIAQLESKIEANIAEINKIEKLSESKLIEYEEGKAGFDRINEEITAARINVTTCNERKAHADDLVARINASIREIDEELLLKQQLLDNQEKEKSELTSGHGDVDGLIREQEAVKRDAEGHLNAVSEEKAAITAKLTGLNEERDEFNEKIQHLQDQKYELDVRKAKNETQLETYKEKLWEDFEISYIQAMEFRSDKFVMSTAVRENREIRNRIRELGEVNVGAIEEYETVRERLDFLTGERDDMQEAMDDLNKIISDMDKTIRVLFKESFDQIVINFEAQFKELFSGGHAELRLSDENNPLESTIDIVAQPPGKKLQNINLLSGGEKALTAIALMFAVLQAKPTPFCVLDEVEAALDDANIERFIRCLRQFDDIQFTLVTHQKATMEKTDVLYGVTMPERGVSKVLSLNMADDLSTYAK